MTIYCNRRLKGLFIVAGGALLAACGAPPATDASPAETRILARIDAAPATAITVHRDPNCGCCGAWADIASHAGYRVKVENHADIATVKASLGVPDELASCHTSVVGGYVVEGHVPLAQVDKLLREQPDDIVGIAVPGMPRGSPGMEMPDGTVDPFEVMAFDAAGRIRPFV